MKTFTIIAAILTLLSNIGTSGIIWPVYGNTQAQYNKVIQNAHKTDTIAIINPINGTGRTYSSFVELNTKRMQVSGANVYGYINTFYTKRSITSVLSEMNRYNIWYKVDGFFYDEVPLNNYNYYKILKDSTNKGIIGNPGENINAKFLDVFDIIVTFEDPYTDRWISHVPSISNKNNICAIVYNVPAYRMYKVVDRSRQKGYNWIFITDRKLPDPYGISPSYTYQLFDYVGNN